MATDEAEGLADWLIEEAGDPFTARLTRACREVRRSQHPHHDRVQQAFDQLADKDTTDKETACPEES